MINTVPDKENMEKLGKRVVNLFSKRDMKTNLESLGGVSGGACLVVSQALQMKIVGTILVLADSKQDKAFHTVLRIADGFVLDGIGLHTDKDMLEAWRIYRGRDCNLRNFREADTQDDECGLCLNTNNQVVDWLAWQIHSRLSVPSGFRRS